jgi:hypothetical protein
VECSVATSYLLGVINKTDDICNEAFGKKQTSYWSITNTENRFEVLGGRSDIPSLSASNVDDITCYQV